MNNELNIVTVALLSVAFAAGLVLGAFYFIALWRTVRKLPDAPRPLRLMLGSFVQSAFGVSDEMRRQIESALKKQITNGFTIRYMMEPEIVSGIELRVNGHKIAWSLNDYLETLVENLTETLQREAQGVS